MKFGIQKKTQKTLISSFHRSVVSSKNYGNWKPYVFPNFHFEMDDKPRLLIIYYFKVRIHIFHVWNIYVVIYSVPTKKHM